MNKQIEEMAQVLEFVCDLQDKDSCIADCDICRAKALYTAGFHKTEWISVEERLPEDGVWVLGYSAKSGRGGLCNCLKSYVREFGNYDDTTHWLPLPEFPKKGVEGK